MLNQQCLHTYCLRARTRARELRDHSFNPIPPPSSQGEGEVQRSFFYHRYTHIPIITC